jgi:hypothetical protein
MAVSLSTLPLELQQRIIELVPTVGSEPIWSRPALLEPLRAVCRSWTDLVDAQMSETAVVTGRKDITRQRTLHRPRNEGAPRPLQAERLRALFVDFHGVDSAALTDLVLLFVDLVESAVCNSLGCSGVRLTRVAVKASPAGDGHVARCAALSISAPRRAGMAAPAQLSQDFGPRLSANDRSALRDLAILLPPGGASSSKVYLHVGRMLGLLRRPKALRSIRIEPHLHSPDGPRVNEVAAFLARHNQDVIDLPHLESIDLGFLHEDALNLPAYIGVRSILTGVPPGRLTSIGTVCAPGFLKCPNMALHLPFLTRLTLSGRHLTGLTRNHLPSLAHLVVELDEVSNAIWPAVRALSPLAVLEFLDSCLTGPRHLSQRAQADLLNGLSFASRSRKDSGLDVRRHVFRCRRGCELGIGLAEGTGWLTEHYRHLVDLAGSKLEGVMGIDLGWAVV